MAIKTYMESSLGTSEVFQLFNNMDGEKVLQKRALDLIKTAKKITSEDIEAAYITVRQIVEGLTRAAMKAFDEERVILLYNNDPAKSMLQAVPFITFTVGGQPKTYVFVDKYITVSRDGVMQIQSPIFRDLLIAGTIANGIRRDYSNLANNQYLMKILMEVYDEFFTRIINRDYSIAADKKMFDTIRYWINRFFLEHVYGANDSAENIHTLAASHVKFLDEVLMIETKQQYESANPTKLSELLSLIKTISPRMKTLDMGRFLTSWTNYYYVPATLAVDNIEYLLFMVITLLNGDNIVNISASDVVKEAKNIKSLRGELLKLI